MVSKSGKCAKTGKAAHRHRGGPLGYLNSEPVKPLMGVKAAKAVKC